MQFPKRSSAKPTSFSFLFCSTCHGHGKFCCLSLVYFLVVCLSQRDALLAGVVCYSMRRFSKQIL